MNDYSTDDLLGVIAFGLDPRRYDPYDRTRAEAERILAEHDRQVKAEAWAEGFDAGHYTGDEPRECECKINPYLNGDNK